MRRHSNIGMPPFLLYFLLKVKIDYKIKIKRGVLYKNRGLLFLFIVHQETCGREYEL